MSKLINIKILHTLIWIGFNCIILYLIYAVAINRIGAGVWICIGLIVLEGIILLIFKMNCPLTRIARKYSRSLQPNFDIFLPNWLALNNKVIYTSIFAATMVALFLRLLTNS
jgi:cbb3-type cytochrome oxidase subunit 1